MKQCRQHASQKGIRKIIETKIIHRNLVIDLNQIQLIVGEGKQRKICGVSLLDAHHQG